MARPSLDYRKDVDTISEDRVSQTSMNSSIQSQTNNSCHLPNFAIFTAGCARGAVAGGWLNIFIKQRFARPRGNQSAFFACSGAGRASAGFVHNLSGGGATVAARPGGGYPHFLWTRQGATVVARKFFCCFGSLDAACTSADAANFLRSPPVCMKKPAGCGLLFIRRA